MQRKRVVHASNFRIAFVLLFSLFAFAPSRIVPAGGPAVESVNAEIAYREYTLPEGPWVVQVLEIPRKSPNTAIGVALGGRHVLGLEPLDRLAPGMTAGNRKAIGGVNGDFYILQQGPYQGDPIGLCVADGELLSTPIRRSAAVILENGEPGIGCFRFKSILRRPDGETVRIDGVNQQCPMNGIALLTPSFNDSTRTYENAVALLAGPLENPLAPKGKYTFSVREVRNVENPLAIPPKSVVIIGHGAGRAFLEQIAPGERITCTLDIDPSPGNIRHAVGGGPRLLRDGNISIEAKEEGISESFVTTRHPRTAFGFNRDRIFLVTVDGRQPGYSLGMNLPELADFMLSLGAREALNLDGGGSTTMWVGGSVKNRPSDGRVRPIANALIVYEK